MGTDEPKIDPHVPIDLTDAQRVEEVTRVLDATPQELTAAVEKVGSQPVAVAIYLGKPGAI